MHIEKYFGIRLLDGSLDELLVRFCFDSKQLTFSVPVEEISSIRISNGDISSWVEVNCYEIKDVIVSNFNRESKQAYIDMAERRSIARGICDDK